MVIPGTSEAIPRNTADGSWEHIGAWEPPRPFLRTLSRISGNVIAAGVLVRK